MQEKIVIQQSFPTLQNILILRALAAMMVCYFHFTCGNVDYLPKGHVLKEVGRFGAYGVDIFFVVSGFVIPYSLAKYGYKYSAFLTFLKRRFWRIEIPYLASLMLAVGVGIAVAYYKKTTYSLSWGQFLAHFFYLNSFLGYDWLVPVYWTLAIEFQFYVWIGLCFPYLFSTQRQARLFGWIIWIGLAYLFPQDIWVFQYVGLFGLGILLCAYRLQKIEIFELGIGTLSCILLIIQKIGYFSAIFAIFAYGIILLEYAFKASEKPFLLMRVLGWVGKISYSLYLTHVVVAGKLIGFVEQKTSFLTVRIWAIPMAMLISLLVAYLFYTLIERHFQTKNLAYTHKQGQD